MFTVFAWNIDFVKFLVINYVTRIWLIEILYNINLVLLNVNLPCIFTTSVNSNILFFLPSFHVFSHNLNTCTIAMKNLRNIHAVSTSQVEDTVKPPLHEKCPNTEFFLVRIFPHSDWIRRDTEYLSLFSPNAGIYRPEKTPYLDTFYVVLPIMDTPNSGHALNSGQNV